MENNSIPTAWSLDPATTGTGLAALARLLLDLAARDRQAGAGGAVEPTGHGAGQAGAPAAAVLVPRRARAKRHRERVEAGRP